MAEEIYELVQTLRSLSVAQQLGVLTVTEGMKTVLENKKQRINRRSRFEPLPPLPAETS